MRNGSYGPSPYPPFVALFFRSFARLRYEVAFLLWAAISLSLYLAGIRLAMGAIFRGRPLQQSILFCYALAFAPFLIETLISGQLSAIAVCAVGIAFYAERRGWAWQSGLALSLLAYKPTLLVLLLPMLLLRRRWKALLGCAAGVVLLLLLTTLIEGSQVWPAYVRLLGTFSRSAGLGGHAAIELWKYVDASSLSYALPGGRSWPMLTLLLVCMVAVGTWLASLLWRSANRGHAGQPLAWAATLTWTLLLNVYVPIYDTVLAVVSVVLTLGAVMDTSQQRARSWVIWMAVGLLGVSWITQPIAKAHGIQLISLMLALLGCGQLVLLQRAVRSMAPEENCKMQPLL